MRGCGNTTSASGVVIRPSKSRMSRSSAGVRWAGAATPEFELDLMEEFEQGFRL